VLEWQDTAKMQQVLIILSASGLLASVVALPAKLPGHSLLFLEDNHDALSAHVEHAHEDPLIAVPSFASNTFLALPNNNNAFGAQSGYNYEAPSRGYNYDPPAVPSGLYEVPTTTTTTTTTTPPPPPPAAYLPPDNVVPRPNEPVPSIVAPPPKSMDMLMPYNIGWEVKDDEYGVQMNHVEDSDGANVSGEYSVLLPDGRLQIVRFTSDPINGYQAEVIYQ